MMAQTFEKGSGKAVIYFEANTKVIVRLDTNALNQTKLPFSLKVGKYVVRAWAPTKQLFVDTISILDHRTTILARRLKNTKAYNKYREDVVIYKFKKAVTAFVPFPLALGYSVYMLNQYTSNGKAMNQHLASAKTAGVSYGKSISNADVVKYTQEYGAEKNSYEECRAKNNQLVKTCAIFIPAAWVTSAALFYLSKKIHRPAAYTEIPLLSLNAMSLRSDYPSSCSLGVNLTINR
jgi:hypothetical protein